MIPKYIAIGASLVSIVCFAYAAFEFRRAAKIWREVTELLKR